MLKAFLYSFLAYFVLFWIIRGICISAVAVPLNSADNGEFTVL